MDLLSPGDRDRLSSQGKRCSCGHLALIHTPILLTTGRGYCHAKAKEGFCACRGFRDAATETGRPAAGRTVQVDPPLTKAAIRSRAAKRLARISKSRIRT